MPDPTVFVNPQWENARKALEAIGSKETSDSQSTGMGHSKEKSLETNNLVTNMNIGAAPPPPPPPPPPPEPSSETNMQRDGNCNQFADYYYQQYNYYQQQPRA